MLFILCSHCTTWITSCFTDTNKRDSLVNRVAYICDRLTQRRKNRPLAVHKGAAEGTATSVQGDSSSAGSAATNKVVVEQWVELLGSVSHHRVTHLALIHRCRAADLSPQIDEFYSLLITFAKNYCLSESEEFRAHTHTHTNKTGKKK